MTSPTRAEPLTIRGGHTRRALHLMWIMLRRTMGKFGRDNGLFLASGLAFNLLLYSIPLALILISVLGYTVLESDQAMEEVQAVIRQFLPRSEQVFAEHVAAIATDRGLLGAVGFASFLAFSTLVFGSIRHVLNVVFQAGAGRSLWRGTVHDLLMMLFCTVLLVATIAVASAFTVLDYLGEVMPGTGPVVSWGVGVVQKAASLFMAGILVFGLYRLSPATTLETRSLVVGSIVAVGLFEFAKQAFTWYVAFAQAQIAFYGVLGAFVFFFLWLYYASAVFVLGAEAAWAHERVAVLRRSERGRPGSVMPEAKLRRA